MATMRMQLLLSLPVLVGSFSLASVGVFHTLPGSLCAALTLTVYVWFASSGFKGSWQALALRPYAKLPESGHSDVSETDGQFAVRLEAAMRRERVDRARLCDLQTRLDAARTEAERAKAAKRAFLSNVGHEIRTPINAIIGMTRLSMQTELSPQQRDYLERADRAAHNLLGEINSILDYVKLEAGDLRIEDESFLLDDVLDTVLGLSSLAVGEKAVKIRLEKDATLPRSLVGDARRLIQVLLNLADNTIKYTQAGEVVIAARLLRVGSERAEVDFEVRDTRIGIETVEQHELFDAFMQADHAATRCYSGSALGLSISHRLVAAMGGRLTVINQPGRGSCFNFALSLQLRERRQGNSRDADANGGKAPVVERRRAELAPLLMDLSSTRLRLRGDERLLRRLLYRFRNDYVGFVEDYASLHHAGDRIGASRLARSLESAAGSLGAIELNEAATRLAMKRRNDDDPRGDLRLVRRLLDGLLGEIDERIAAADAGSDNSITEPTETDLSLAEVRIAIRELAELLSEFDAAALNCFEELSVLLSTLVARDAIDDLQRTINGFDFARALEQLRQIAHKLGVAFPVAG